MWTLSNQQMESKNPAQAQNRPMKEEKKEKRKENTPKERTLFEGCLLGHSVKNSLVHLHTACTDTARAAEARQTLPIAPVKQHFRQRKMADEIQ